MTPEDLVDLVIEALSLVLLLSAPAVIASLVMGLIVSFFQAATQLQEPTLSFVPRLAAVGIALLLFGGWIGAEMLRFTQHVWEVIP